MSSTTIHPRPNGHTHKNGGKAHRRPNYNQIHRNSLPVEIHPLPTLIPHNPLSLVTIALSYLIQVLSPPERQVYKGYFSSATSSIHITDEDTQRALWEQGFFGKGNLSRSEPTWLENQKRAGTTAEENTDKRRSQRKQFKMNRAKQEQLEISEQLSQDQPKTISSNAEMVKTNEHDFSSLADVLHGNLPPRSVPESPLSKTTDDAKPGSLGDLPPRLADVREGSPQPVEGIGGNFEGFEEWKKAIDANGLPTPPPTSTCSEVSQPETRPKRLQRTKTVRFSPTIEAREFDLSSPVISPIKAPGTSRLEEAKPVESSGNENKEHLQLSLEEAFFLSYGLGVLDVYPDDSEVTLNTTSLLSLFRRHSYSPSRSLSVPSEPDDPFMISYAAYHHFRSMGWVVRSGVKFGVDYLLYNRGPAFSHAEFSVVVLPSYSDPHWEGTHQQKGALEEKSKKSWWWLHGVNRVQAQVHKHLVLCYVDIPAPESVPKGGRGGDIDIGYLFERYKVRDVNIKRWTPNRSRD